MIDWTRVTDLREEIGDEEFPEIAALFLEEADHALARFDGGNDAAGDLHFLKGSALTLGFSDLVTDCERGEALLHEGKSVDPDALRQVYRASRAAFLQGLSEMGVQVNR